MPADVRVHYPFSAVVGCEPDALDDMGLALVLNAIAPEIGGVLVRGEKGTAKSTTVRALAAVLPPIEVFDADRFSVDPDDPTAVSPDGPFASAARVTRPVRLVELPVGATEDRVLGSLHLERALAHGKVEYEPGLLARAHRGILYVDEVNLLHDHLVDLLLDAAATGRSTVERDGVSVEHAANFILIGTMNPEEGELRPQLLDRFGLTVEIAAPREPALRAEVVRRRIAYDANPGAFADRYAADEVDLSQRIEKARLALESVELSDTALLTIARVCAGFEVDGLRADIVTARTAVAHAAWSGRSSVTKADIRRAALLALPHRRRRNPFDAPGLDEELLDELLRDDDPQPPDRPSETEEPEGSEAEEAEGRHETQPEKTESSTPERESSTPERESSTPERERSAQEGERSAGEETRVSASQPYRPKLFSVRGLGEGSDGRRSRAVTTRGRVVGVAPRGSGGSLHIVETLRAAAGSQVARGRVDGPLALRAEDLRRAVRIGHEANLVLFCVDASGSMAARKRMTAVKTAILSLLLDAYRRRDKVALVTFRGTGAEVLLPPTRSVDAAAARLDEIPAGGRTPLAAGLLEASRVIQRERIRDPRTRPLLVVVTDGRATDGPDGVARSLQAADHLAALGVTTVVVDSESGPMRFGLARRLAERMGAEHLPVAEVSAAALQETVDSRVRGVA